MIKILILSTYKNNLHYQKTNLIYYYAYKNHLYTTHFVTKMSNSNKFYNVALHACHSVCYFDLILAMYFVVKLSSNGEVKSVVYCWPGT